MPKLTAHLLDLAPDAFKRATEHPFLKQAGTAALPRPILLAWLTQDRLYALNYIPFMGNLLSKCNIPTSADRTSTLSWRIADELIGALINVRREIAMFEDILRTEFNWKDGGEEMRVQTKAYSDLFAGAGAQNASLLEGMVVLWATEKCYFEAWKYARSHIETGKGEGDVLTKTLIPNWTNEEFEQFVVNLENLLDELAKEVQPGPAEMKKSELAWRQILWAEENFWPDVEV